ncbi:tetratricopeptide repeat protein [Blastopirellula marina]|uniref:Tetratricopeptide repeat protein n=1 Tax=Blastopirellula marina TaxID=124 RepID=A0A2S8FLR8_9BACT|nr:tetratricopeptide repeat protein [Blastopirellula marina]PQO33132.1 hypothetical protein C5Y98_18555 [Blastopirellula marina]PTL43299.1 tetratricopeptide repeat protein [Blastopirellula marina]
MPWNNRLGRVIAAVCLLLTSPLAVPMVHAQSSTPPPPQVENLIDQLGDTNFLVRERAQTDLARMGVTAFDQLFGAMRDDDPEVARRAQYLIRSVEIEWPRPEFSEEVNSYLNRYGSLNIDNRRSRIGELGRLHSIDALSALCRISRYDVSEAISKEAALAAAIQFQGAKGEEKEQVVKIITDRIGDSPRTGPSWLQIFRKSLDHPDQATQEWQAQVQKEIDLFTTRPAMTSQQTVLDLVRWEVDQLRSEGKQEEALAAMRDVIRISSKFSESELIDLTTWFLDRKGPSVVTQLAAMHAENHPVPDDRVMGGPFGDNPSLLYLLAEAELVQNHIDLANQYADAALEMVPEAFDSHYLTAQALQERGCYRWSRREFQHVIDNNKIDDQVSIFARVQYAELEHDHGNSKRAMEIMWPWVEVAEKKGPGKSDPFGGRALEEVNGASLARAYLFRATYREQQGKFKEAQEDLLKALKHDEDEADVLIAAYRLGQKDELWQTKAKEHIDHTIAFYKPYIERFENQYEFFKKNRRGDDTMGAQSAQMARYCNQYAWLVGNTYGDFDHAIAASQLSLELVPGNGAYLDTLAHCYAAKGDWEKALQCQRQAVQQMPHSGMVRQKYLEFVEECKKHKIDVQPLDLPSSPDTHFPDFLKDGEK